MSIKSCIWFWQSFFFSYQKEMRNLYACVRGASEYWVARQGNRISEFKSFFTNDASTLFVLFPGMEFLHFRVFLVGASNLALCPHTPAYTMIFWVDKMGGVVFSYVGRLSRHSLGQPVCFFTGPSERYNKTKLGGVGVWPGGHDFAHEGRHGYLLQERWTDGIWVLIVFIYVFFRAGGWFKRRDLSSHIHHHTKNSFGFAVFPFLAYLIFLFSSFASF